MEKITEKICPLLYTGWLAFKGSTTQADTDEIACMGSQCAWWNEEKEECKIVSK